MKKDAGHAHAQADAHEEHHPEPVARDPDLPSVTDGTLAFFAAGALVVFTVAMLTLI
jgi:hypothetical protein